MKSLRPATLNETWPCFLHHACYYAVGNQTWFKSITYSFCRVKAAEVPLSCERCRGIIAGEIQKARRHWIIIEMSSDHYVSPPVPVVTSGRTKRYQTYWNKWEFVISGCSLCNEAQIHSHTSTYLFVTQQAEGLKGCFAAHSFMEIAVCLRAKHPFYLHFHYRGITVPKKVKSVNQFIFEHVFIHLFI